VADRRMTHFRPDLAIAWSQREWPLRGKLIITRSEGLDDRQLSADSCRLRSAVEPAGGDLFYRLASFSAAQPVSGRQQDLFELLQQLTIADEIARGVFLPHIAKHGASALEPIDIFCRRC
jgi:hypothetical protein